jgi:dipeptidyl aminopeptidase/acylaminoacyl peptidase
MHRRGMGTARVEGAGVGPVDTIVTAPCSQQGFSSDGRWSGLSCPVDGQHRNQTELLAIATDGGAIRPLSRAVDRNYARARWTPDGTALIATAPDAGGTGLWTFPIEGSPRRWTLGSVYTAGDLDMSSDGRVAFVVRTSERADEIYHLAAPDREPVRITDFQSALAGLRLGKAETLYWTNDGLPFSGGVPRSRRRSRARRHGGAGRADCARFDRHLAHRRFGLVLRRLHDHLADRP